MKFPRRPRTATLAALLCLISTFYASGAPPADSAPSTKPLPAPKPGMPTSLSVETAIIPGPLRSFLRMAGISQSTPTDRVLAYFAHNVYTFGYQSNKQTEFLILIDRYLHQAREL